MEEKDRETERDRVCVYVWRSKKGDDQHKGTVVVLVNKAEWLGKQKKKGKEKLSHARYIY